MEEIIIPVIIVSIIQIVLIILFVQATVNIKRIYDLLYIDRQEKIEAKKKEAQTEQKNHNNEPQPLVQLRAQLMDQARSSSYNDNNDEYEENSNIMTNAKWILGISVIIFIIVGLYAVLS